jgi:hypothetical protein
MKKLLASLILGASMISGVFAGSQLIVTSKLGEDNMPVDKLQSIPFDKDRQFLMFVYKDDNTAFGVEKVYFEISIYDEESSKYKYSDMYTVDTHTDWGYCYKGILFNMPMKLKIRVFTADGELATKYIEVVKEE